MSYDIRATCHLAARELLSLNCATYAYAGYGKDVSWSEERKRIFTQSLWLNGHATETFDLNPAVAKPPAFYRKLTNWLQRIDKPAGILAADDAYAVSKGNFLAILQQIREQAPHGLTAASATGHSPRQIHLSAHPRTHRADAFLMASWNPASIAFVSFLTDM